MKEVELLYQQNDAHVDSPGEDEDRYSVQDQPESEGAALDSEEKSEYYDYLD